jgi:non-ribosomal peptide synthetase component F
MKPSDHLITTLLAILKAGAAYLPISFHSTQISIENIFKKVKPVMVIYDDFSEHAKFFSTLKSMTYKYMKKESFVTGDQNIRSDLTLSGDNVDAKAVVVCDSGSRVIKLSHRSLSNQIQWLLKTFPLTETFCAFSTEFSLPEHVLELWSPLIGGRTVVIIPKTITQNPERLLTMMRNYKFERFFSDSTFLHGFLLYVNMVKTHKTIKWLRHMKTWMLTDANLKVETAKNFLDYFANGNQKLVIFYGQTETGCVAAFNEINSCDELEAIEKISIGIAVDNFKMYVLNDHKQPVGDGEIGQIYISGDFVDGTEENCTKNPFENETRKV